MEAIEKFNEYKNEVKLLLLDVIMPKKNGKDVYEEIRKSTPDIKALFISGYAAELMDMKNSILNQRLESEAKGPQRDQYSTNLNIKSQKLKICLEN